MFGYPCPSCAQRLLASPDRAGQRTICPKCLKPIVIPTPPAPPPPDDDPEPVLNSVQLSGGPITHQVEADDESALRADAAAQATPFPSDDSGPWAMPHADPAPAAVADPEPDPEPPAAPTPPPEPTPAPRPPRTVRPAAAPKPAAVRPDHTAGMVVFNPTSVESMDIAAELTAALTLRMKPPPEPPSDLPVSTGLWLATTAVGLSLWLYAVLYQPIPLPYVALLGGIQVLLGYAWVAYHAGRHGAARGLVAALPPVAIKKLVAPGSSSLGYRPLRFVLTGLVLLGLAAVGPAVRPAMQGLFGMTETGPSRLPEVPDTPLTRIQEAERQASIQPLVDVLRELAKPAALNVALSDAERAQLVGTFERLLDGRKAESRTGTADADAGQGSDRHGGDVRAAALAALVTWNREAAPGHIQSAFRSEHERLRREAIEQAQWWPPLARPLAGRLVTGDRDEWDDVKRSLAEMCKKPGGQAAAEEALLPLAASDDFQVRASALEVLSQVGGRSAASALKAAADKLRDGSSRRRELDAAAKAISDRVGKD